MEYMMFVVVDPEGEPYVESEDNFREWNAEMHERGIGVDGRRLVPADEAKTVRVRNGELLLTDGPFVESKEWVAGFAILECADLDEAIEVASRHAMARFGRIEVRPFWPFDPANPDD